jgi:O-antigen ligase
MTAVLRDLRGRPVTLPSFFVVGVVALGVALLMGWWLWVLAIAIIVPTLVASYRRPQRGVLIFVVIVTFDGVIKGLGPPSAGIWKQIFIIALLVLTFVCPPEARATGRRRLPGWVPAFLGLLVLGLLSAAVLVDQTTAQVGLRISYFSVLLAVVIWRCPLSRRERDHLVTIFVALGILTSVVGIWQQFVGHEYLYNLGYKYDDQIRFTTGMTLRSFSTFDIPFSFGFYLMLVILICLPMSMAQPRRLRSKIFFLSLPLLSIALLYTFVRGAMLGLAVGLLYLAFHRYKLLVFGLPFVLVAALFIPSGAVLTNAVFGSTSLGDRTTSWSDRFHQIVEHPLGSGIGTTGAAADKTAQLKNTDQGLAFQPDNSYLKVTFEIGIPGLWLLVMMLISMFLFTRSVERRVTGIDKDFVAGVSAQWLAIMASALVATYLELVPMDQMFWLMIGIVATMAPVYEEGPAIGAGATSAAG